MRRQMNHGALSIEPQLTFKWTPMHLEMNPRAFFFKVKNPQKNQCFKKPKLKLQKPSILKYIY